jgi:hypothetical protein
MPRTYRFSDRRCGYSWIALITCGFRVCERSLFVVVFGYLEVFCDHKVSKRTTAQWITGDLGRRGSCGIPLP